MFIYVEREREREREMKEKKIQFLLEDKVPDEQKKLWKGIVHSLEVY